MPAVLSAKMATIAGGYFPPKHYMDFVTLVIVLDFSALLVSPPYLPVSQFILAEYTLFGQRTLTK